MCLPGCPEPLACVCQKSVPVLPMRSFGCMMQSCFEDVIARLVFACTGHIGQARRTFIFEARCGWVRSAVRNPAWQAGWVGCAIGVCVGEVAIATSMALQAPMQRCMGPRRQAAVRVEAKKPTVHQRIADKNKTKSGSSSGTRINPDRLCNERDYKPARQAFNVALHRAPTGVAMHMHMRRCQHHVHDA